MITPRPTRATQLRPSPTSRRRQLPRRVFARLLGVGALLACTSATAIASESAPANQVYATAVVEPNQPIGDAKGIFPGRVVWIHNPKAVNQDCVVDAPGHGWYLPENHRQPVVDAMVASALHDLTGESTDAAAWSAIFRYHNRARGKGPVDYARGEKIFIKINATSAWTGNFNPADLTPVAYISETSIASVRAVLRQLVNVVGVNPRDIYVGDPLKHVYKHLYDVWHAEFPDVHYLDNGGYTNLGRETVTPSATALIRYSDRGTVLRTNVWSNNYPGDSPVTQDSLYGIFETAEYLINLPMLKGHRRAGVTMFAKNHFGSHTRGDASHLHNGLVAPTEIVVGSRAGYGLYRVQVDIMGHSLLGRKNLLYLMDALWATDYELDVPLRWQMAPFANSYMASIFASLDPVAIESVGYDFLRAEFTASRIPAAGTYVQMDGVDDYLHQAADRSNWPTGLAYDPDGTGVSLPSLGTHEHWNNATDRRYSRNLAATGRGIELVQVDQALRVAAVANQSVRASASASFSVAATGTPPVSYQWERRAAGASAWVPLTDDGNYLGAHTSTLTISTATPAMNTDAFRCVVADVAGSSHTSNGAVLYIVQPGAGRLFDLSARAHCAGGDRVAIGGLVIAGGAKRVLLRAVGPTLTTQQLAAGDVLADPVIELHDARDNSIVARNDNWTDAANAAEISATARRVGAMALEATDHTSSAMLLTLQPGGYSFVATGREQTSGIVLVEVYDADDAPTPGRLFNLSARGDCRTGDRVTIGGLVIAGAAKRVLVRAVGPSLDTQGIATADALRDPQIEVHSFREHNAVIARNDNWSDNANAGEVEAVARTVGAVPLAPTDMTSSSLLLSLEPGSYSFVASGVAGSTGIVLVEVYEVE